MFKDEDQYKHPNFEGHDGRLFLVHCFKCSRENYSLAVATGTYVWCGWHVPTSEVSND